MAIDKCLLEIKNVVKDLLTDDEINIVLTKIRSKIATEQALKKSDINEKKIAQGAIDEIEMAQAINKRNLADDTIKIIAKANHIIENFKDPIKGVKALLVSIEDYGSGARKSIGNEQVALEEKFLTDFFTDLEKADVTDIFTSGKFEPEIYRELAEIGSTKSKEARAVAKVMMKHSEIIRTSLNNYGANIGKLDDWLTSQYHDPDKLNGAAGRTVTNWREHQVAWRDYIKTELDLERTFSGSKNVDEILDQMYLSLRSGIFFKSEGLEGVYGSSSLAKKLSGERVLHFKDADARMRYDRKFGSDTLRESIVHGLQLSARNIGLINGLGTKPKANFEKLLTILQKHYVKQDPKFDGKLKYDQFKNEFMEIDGSVYQVDNATGARIGMAIRFLQGTGKLGFATISSFADLATYMTETRFQGRGLFTGLAEALGQMTGVGKAAKSVQDVLQVMSNTTVGTMNQKMSMRGDMTGKFASLSNLFYRMNGLNWWTSNLKSAMTTGVARMYGMKKNLSLDKLTTRERNILTLYTIDSGKWDMLRTISALEADGKTYITAERVSDIPIESIDAYLGRKVSKRQADNFRMDLQISYRNLLLDRAMHGTPEPDAAVRASLSRGWKRGTAEGEMMRLFIQFKQFPVSIWQKIVGREMRGYSPDESKKLIGSLSRSGAIGLTSMVIMGTMMGTMSLATKDLLKGKTPRDFSKKENWFAAFVQGGGLGIYGDFLYSEFKNSYGGGLAETAAGPFIGDLSRFLKMLSKYDNPKGMGKDLLSIVEGNTPFLNLYYTKSIYDYLIGHQLKEYLDPGYFRRMRRRNEKNQGSSYFLTP